MDTMNFTPNVQATVEKPLVKTEANGAAGKKLPKNSGDTAGKQGKEFNEVLTDAVKETENSEDLEAAEQAPVLPFMGIVPAVVIDIVGNSQNTEVLNGNGAGEIVIGEESGPVKFLQDLNAQLLPKSNVFAGKLEDLLPKQPETETLPLKPEVKTSGKELLQMLESKMIPAKMQAFSVSGEPQSNEAQLKAAPQVSEMQSNANLQNRLSDEAAEVLPILKGALAQEGEAALNQQGFSSFGQAKEENLFRVEQKTPQGDEKQLKAALDKILEETPDEKNTGSSLKAAVLPESTGGEGAVSKTDGFAVPVNQMLAAEKMPNQPLTPETPAETPETMAKYKIAEQIIDQARMIKTTEDTQMVIKLRPEHLGDLTLKVTVEHGVVSASFHSDNANVRSMIETSLFQLKQELAAQGIKVDNVSVYAGLGQFMSNGQQQENAGRQGSKFRNRKVDLADFDETAEKVTPERVHDNLSTEGVDYRI